MLKQLHISRNDDGTYDMSHMVDLNSQEVDGNRWVTCVRTKVYTQKNLPSESVADLAKLMVMGHKAV